MNPDELDIIREMKRAAGRLPSGYSPVGDDVAVLPVGGKRLVLKTDMLVGRTDVPRGMTYREAARKAVAMCVSDFGAKGVRPSAFMVSLGVERGTTSPRVKALADGLAEGASEWRLHFVGGDTGEARDLVIDCAMVGFADSVVPRSGAKPGDALVVSGKFGLPPAGLMVMDGAEAERRFAAAAVRSVRRPTPNLEAGMVLARYLTSSMDSSDGLAISLRTLASASGVGIELEDLPAADGVAEFARANGVSAEDLVLGGGEEYLIVGTMKPASLGRAAAATRRAGADLVRIGRITDGSEVLMKRGRKTELVPDVGWTHLR